MGDIGRLRLLLVLDFVLYGLVQNLEICDYSNAPIKIGS